MSEADGTRRAAGLRILLLEDSAFDAELLRASLDAAWPEHQLTWVQDGAGFLRALEQERFDLILSDYELPGFNGAEALDHAHATQPRTPFIFVSGVIGEENAVELLKRGATDYVTKGRLSRLPLVIERALREVAQRDAQQRAQDQLLQAKEEAERSNELKDQFLAVLSHELRSPLSAISGWADILEKQATGNKLLEKAALVIRRNARLQTRMINELLDMSAVVAGKLVLQRETLDLAALTAETLLSHLHVAQERSITLESRGGGVLWVAGDAQRLTQVISNLVGNALKFSTEGAQVLVTTRLDDDGAVLLSVQDSGRGISPEFLPHVFDRLRQEDGSRTRKAGGLGLGLAIARAIVELHGGRIVAHSDGPDLGARFDVRLPVAPPPPMQPVAPRVAADDGDAPRLDGVRVLFVDDEDDAREVGQAALLEMGAAVTVASSAQEALSLLAEQSFDVLLSVIGMPEMDGLSLVRTVRRQAATASLPAIALTAFAMLPDRQAGLAAGFQRYLAKPIDIRRLGGAIREVLQTPLADPQA
jgi:signal transduction histidine kinase